MRTKKPLNNKSKKKRERISWKIFVWLFIGVSLSIMPLFYQATTELFVFGYSIDLVQILPDYILVAFAITGNAIGILIDSSNMLKEKSSRFLLLFLTISLMVLLTTSIAFNPRLKLELIPFAKESIIKGSFVVLSAYIVIIVILGVLIIKKTEK